MGTVWQTVARALTKLNAASFALALSTSLLLPLLTAPIVAHATGGITNTRGDAWGTLEVAGTDPSNLGGTGVDIYSNGAQVSYTPNKPNNTVNSVVSGEEWQCVELINRLYLTKGWTAATWSGNGGQLYDTAPTALNKELNGSITYLNPGDVLVLQDSSAGHAALINTFTGSTGAMQIESQNTNVVFDSTFSLSNKTISSTGWGTYSVKGVVHAPGGGANHYHYQPVAADFNGDGLADIGLRDANNGIFYIKHGTAFSDQITYQWAAGSNYQPFAGDFNHDGYADIGLRDTSTGTIYIKHGPTFGDQISYQWAAGTNYQPFVADFNGDGYADIGLRDANIGMFYIKHGTGFNDQITYSWAGG